jgi:hypothetical protein
MYTFQCLPLNIPKSYFKELDKALSGFLWKGKNPRVKLLKLQAPYKKGGLNLPNFRHYYLTSQFRPIWIWLHPEKVATNWTVIEQWEMGSIPLKVIPFLGSKRCLSSFTKNPLILHTFSAWMESNNLCSLSIAPLRHLPLCENPIIPIGIADSTLKAWASKGLKTLDDLYANNSLMSFELAIPEI